MYEDSVTTSTLFPSKSAVPAGRKVVKAIPSSPTNSLAIGLEINPLSAASSSLRIKSAERRRLWKKLCQNKN